MSTEAIGVHRKPTRDDLEPVGDFAFELPAGWREDMRVPVRVFADDDLLAPMIEGDALLQLVNVATLPGVAERVYGMPDMHEGYGFPVGGVAATRMPDGVISPGGVGFDINCGVRLMALPLTHAEVGARLESFVHDLSRSIPSGTGRGGEWRLDNAEMDAVLKHGSAYVVNTFDFGTEEDVTNTESHGCLEGADPSKVSVRAKERGRGQLGSMGSGNHFVEVQTVESVEDALVAETFGLKKDQVTVLIHTGSRGLGHQVCTDYVKLMDSKLATNRITLPDRQLSCAPVNSPEGNDYLGAMACAANYAWSNRQRIAHAVRSVAVRRLGVGAEDVRTVYDVAHNIAKVETYGARKLCVHRKGATRAFGPESPDVPSKYRMVGQPVFIPGSMGTASWVLVGDARSARQSWGSACHGAGRTLSRHAAKRQVTGAELRHQLEGQGIVVRCPSNAGLAEEAPFAYKDVDAVARVVESAGLARRVARLRPLGVIKG
ncbi:MAG TPA: RtcB family protein [Gemmatimonadaceae bacterium]|nr:RtcB family protein [Gemmatimonadaceae bacterium]